MQRLFGVVFGLSIMVFTPATLAHHGLQAHYDMSKPVVLEGIVTKFAARNPHSYIYLNVTDDNGKTAEWKCEIPSLVILKRRGFTADKIKPGDWFKLEGTAARRDPTGCVLNFGYFADGSTIRMRFRAGNKDKFDTKAAITPNLPEGQEVIAGNWILRAFRPLDENTGFQKKMTPQGELAHKNFNRIVDDPNLRCSAGSPIRAWGAPGTPTEIRIESERIIIHHEIMDVVRVVHLNSEHPKDLPGTEMGHSIGHYEGNDLVIETTAFSAGTMLAHAGDTGMVHSEQLKLTERLAVNPETGVLVLTWTANDPKYFTEPFSDGQELVRTEYKVGEYNCVIEEERDAN